MSCSVTSQKVRNVVGSAHFTCPSPSGCLKSRCNMPHPLYMPLPLWLFSAPALKCRRAIAIPSASASASASTCKMLGQMLKSLNFSLSAFLCPRHKMARGHLVFALSVIPSFRHSVIPSHQSLSSQLLLHPCMDLNETWYRCLATSLEVHVGR